MTWATERKHDPLHPDCTCKECREAFDKEYPISGATIYIPPHPLASERRTNWMFCWLTMAGLLTTLFVYFTGVIH